MIVAVFRRRLKPGKTLEDFTRAWEAERGFGVPARVFTGVSMSDPEEILTVGFVDLDPAQLAEGAAAVAEQEHQRHESIAEVIESTELREFYALGGEFDFTAEPREVDPGSPDSLLAALRRAT